MIKAALFPKLGPPPSPHTMLLQEGHFERTDPTLYGGGGGGGGGRGKERWNCQKWPSVPLLLTTRIVDLASVRGGERGERGERGEGEGEGKQVRSSQQTCRDAGMETRSFNSDTSPPLHTVLLRVVEIKPRKTELSVTKSDDGHWAAYITELVNLRNLKPLEFRKAAESGRVTRITLPQLEPGTPYRVRVRPVENFNEPPIWIDEAIFNTPGERTASLFLCRGIGLQRTSPATFPTNLSGH